ncbi:hypothetical protein AB0O82_32730 [Kitasatospora sp. NPDC088264]|uniref:hypothetical protein n=1 Tax=Kitasatospora sp. NPDC088264 TaxID=3155296 RepID=UPI00343068F0
MTTVPAKPEPTWYKSAREFLDDVDRFVRIEWHGMSTPAKTTTVFGITAAAFGTVALVLGVGWAAASLLGALLGLALRIGRGSVHWAQTTRPWEQADRLMHVVSDPITHYLAGHSASIPFAPGTLFTGWWVAGVLLWVGATRRTGLTGRAVAWSVWATVTTATVWAGTDPGSRWTAAGIAALLLALASWPAYSSAPPATS